MYPIRGAVTFKSPLAVDNCTGPVTVTCTPPSGSILSNEVGDLDIDVARHPRASECRLTDLDHNVCPRTSLPIAASIVE